MGKKAEYKSAKRSRRMILEAYVELMQEKEIEKITVTDVVTRADLNRGTFYAHYQNTQAVLTQIENEIISKMLEFLQEVQYKNFFQDPLPLLLKVASYMEDNFEFFRKLLGTDGSQQFIVKLKDIFVEYMKSTPDIPDSFKKKPEFIIHAHFFAGGISNMYQAWFRGDLDKSLNEISLVIGDIITSTSAMIFDDDK